MTYLLENSAAQVQQMHYKTTQLPDCFYVNSEEFPTCHNKMDLANFGSISIFLVLWSSNLTDDIEKQ